MLYFTVTLLVATTISDDQLYLSTDHPESILTPPFNLSSNSIDKHHITIHWSQPIFGKNRLLGYLIYYQPINHEAHIKTLPVSANETSYVVKDLVAGTEYKFWMTAVDDVGESKTSELISVKTVRPGPGQIEQFNAKCYGDGAIIMEWMKPNEYKLMTFTAFYRDGDTLPFVKYPLEFVNDANPNIMSAILSNLTDKGDYEVFLVASYKGIMRGRGLLEGSPTETVQVKLRPNCEYNMLSDLYMYGDFSVQMLFVVIGFALTVIIMCCITLVIKRLSAIETQTNSVEGWEADDELAINIKDFPNHTALMHADGDLGFSREYKAVTNATEALDLTANVSLQPENKFKNRYLNVSAYDHTRVRFKAMPGEIDGPDYINANFIDGFQKPQAYIGTQGPLPTTIDCFWRMIFEQNVSIIVMITNLMERGKRKCDIYWSYEAAKVYGSVIVSLIKEDVKATYTIRTFNIRLNLKQDSSVASESRNVYQYHFTNWPDHGTPDHPLPILRFIQQSSAANPPNGGPIVVHCSAGVGRTGTYIVLDAMLQMIKVKRKVDVFNFLKYIRTQRNQLVQTEEQYTFIHDVLVEFIESGETNLHQAHIPYYLSTLVANPSDDKSLPGLLLDNQFKLVTSFQPLDYHFTSAHKTMNITKNDGNLILPVDCCRVKLSPKPGMDGSDYINASWFMGYRGPLEYIVVGLPSECNKVDFWQMTMNHSVHTITLFVNLEELNLPPFWPVGKETITGETFTLRMLGEGIDDGVVFIDFSVFSSFKEPNEWTIRMFCYPTWPYSSVPSLRAFDAIHRVQKWNDENTGGPTVLVDRFGTTQGATFCALASLEKQLINEGYADIYTFAKLYHMSRPGCWSSHNDLLFLYDATAEIAQSLPATDVPFTAPNFLGLGPSPNVPANGKHLGYIRCRSNSENLDAVEDEFITPDCEGTYNTHLQGDYLLPSNGDAHYIIEEDQTADLIKEESV